MLNPKTLGIGQRKLSVISDGDEQTKEFREHARGNATSVRAGGPGALPPANAGNSGSGTNSTSAG